ncbi:MAG: sugar phosphate isomerase/epimerase family protein [Inquilinus sp.]|uniref:sugar phosphate isomerase/epimerase family protein n=1 Tax=Inquilinus sp. TaxID=1932117 RepID=UPI003F3B7CE8
MQRLLVLQSLWSMERRHTDGFERTLEANVEMIAGAGFDGISAHWTDRDEVRRTADCLRGTGMVAEAMCFPKTVDDLNPVLEIAAEFPVHHINLQPDVRPRRLEECVPLIEGWRRLAEQVDVPVLIETHRDRMTTDLYFTLDLLDRFPDLPLLADLSHFLVGREFAWPVSDENHALIHRILENSWAFHGRVASREQAQIEIAFPHHRMWVDLFLDWWGYGFRSWRRRAAADATLSFTCELGPKPYAITGRDGNDTTDRWAESLTLAGLARDLWAETAAG